MSTSDDLSTGFTVDQSPAEVFAAVNDPRAWWSTGIQGPTDQAGEEFVYNLPGVHYSKVRVAELEPARRVVWQVVEATMHFVEDTEEWTGTEIRFELAECDPGTELTFTHVGISPAVECYEACSKGWELYIGTSLRNLITTGTGEPGSHPEEQDYVAEAGNG